MADHIEQIELFSLPALVQDKLLGYIGYDARKTIRDSSKYGRRLIDSNKYYLNSVTVRFNFAQMALDFVDCDGSRGQIEYVDNLEGSLYNGNRIDTPMPQAFKTSMECVIEELRVMFLSPKMEIGEFVVKARNYYNNAGPTLARRGNALVRQFFEGLSRMLKQLGHPINVEVFSIYYHGNENDVLQVLPFLNSNKIQKISFSLTPSFSTQDKVITHWQNIVQLNQWKKARTICTKNAFHGMPMEKYWDYPTVHMHVDSMNFEQFNKLIEHYLTSETFEEAKLGGLDPVQIFRQRAWQVDEDDNRIYRYGGNRRYIFVTSKPRLVCVRKLEE